eukprot:Em0012g214a
MYKQKFEEFCKDTFMDGDNKGSKTISRAKDATQPLLEQPPLVGEDTLFIREDLLIGWKSIPSRKKYPPLPAPSHPSELPFASKLPKLLTRQHYFFMLVDLTMDSEFGSEKNRLRIEL